MANKIEEWIPKLASEWNTKFEKLDDGITWAIDVPFKLNDKTRFQWVYITYGVGVAKGNDIYDVRSKVGDYSAGIDLHGLLQEAKYGFYSAICIREFNRDGKQVEVVFVQASPLAEHVNTYEQLKFIVEEVGSTADLLEDKFYGGIDKT
jgi:hypothetical protein